jgi:hypothetical protein
VINPRKKGHILAELIMIIPIKKAHILTALYEKNACIKFSRAGASNNFI